ALGGEQLSGDFSINYATGELTPLSGENAGSVLTLNCDIALGDTPAEIYVPVPPGTYQSGFKVDFTDSEGNVLSRQTGPRTLAAGQLRAMPEVHWSVNGIASAADFADFASAVNSGASTAQWEDSNGVVNLLSDIDFTGVDSWTPAGLAVVVWASNKLSVASGHPFEGKFNGRGHSIKNFNFSYSASDASATKSSNGSVACGIFGCLAPGAVVENLVIDGSCSFKFSPQVRSDAGIVAGLVNEAAVRNITNYAPMELDNKAEDDVRQTMSIVGFAFADAGESVIEFIENRGDVSANCGQNIKNGATGVMISGILGFGTNDAASKTCVNVSHCVNYGELNSNAARSSGIVSASNRYTIIEWCDNHGNNYNSFPTSGGGRIANITCITGLGSSIRNCTNYADAICSTKARTGGIVSLINNASCSFVGVANYGRIITDETTYRGTIFQQCNFAATFSGCIGGGDVGTYNGGSYQMVGLNSGNYFNYVGYHNAAAVNVTADNIVYGDAPEWKGISSAEDLQALAQTVNSGGDVSPFMSGGKIQILCDINASSIKDWVPIGTESHPFSYTLDGMGHCIRNFNWTVDAVNYKHAGLIGYASDAKICNLVFGNPGSSITFNGNAAKLRAGAIVGYAYAVTMENVTNNATLQVSGSQAYGNALIIGGLAGYSSGESFIGGESSASACVNNGNILVPLVCQQAGLVGYNSGQVKNCVNNGAVLGKLDGSQYGPAWGCSYNRKKTYFVNNSGYGHVGDYDEFLSNPAAAPADNYYNAVRQEYETYFDPESNEVDMTLDSYYDWTKQSSLNLGAGVKYTHYTFDNVPRHMHVLEMDLSNPSLEIVAALADDIIPNPNGRDNEHLNAGFYYRETLSRLCSRKRSAGEKILAGANMGYFDSEAGILRGFHVQEGVPLYINNPAVVSRLQNHRWGFAVFADGTATCGVKTFSGKLRTGGVEYDYHSVNDTTLRKSWPGHSPVNLF
ncbi:MAG: hypothetical protein J5764_00960, partial [Bacteroidales bacterium]|nr:hypothetical protein [Bacteroidales bacterium]